VGVSTLLEILRMNTAWRRLATSSPCTSNISVSTLLEILRILWSVDTPEETYAFQPFLRFYTGGNVAVVLVGISGFNPS